MPLDWKIDHGPRLVVVTARGSILRQEVDDLLAATESEGAVGYATIVDARAAGAEFRLADLAAFSQVVNARRTDVSTGAIALVVDSEAEREMGAYFVNLTIGQRPCRLFANLDDARTWLGDLERGASASA